jgi:hypothetical protein
LAILTLVSPLWVTHMPLGSADWAWAGRANRLSPKAARIAFLIVDSLYFGLHGTDPGED